jgi:four helix bundle protein
MVAKRFQDLIAWRLARELRRELWRLCLKPSVAKEPNFCYQVRKSARSVTANIAEGFPCGHVEFARFLDISSRSLKEIEDRLIEGVDEKLFTQAEAMAAFTFKKRTAAAVSKLTIYLRSTPDPPTFRPRPSNRRRKNPALEG